jgi:hypothetical protein
MSARLCYSSAVFIKRNHSRRGDSEYSSVLLVQGERIPAPRKAGRPPKHAERKTVVVHRTLANLSKLPAGLVALIERFCQAERDGAPLDGFVATEEPVIGAAYGPLASLLALAREAGIERALGFDRDGRLALFLVLARVAHRGSRLSSVRWAGTQAVAEVLGLGRFDEDDLYAALDWLDEQQERIEAELAPRNAQGGAVFLYDVTSSYLEGQKNELAAPGYNRDGKRYKKQIVAGLLTDCDGEPVSVQVYEGNTSDPDTVGDQVRKLALRFGAQDIVLVGDRGMIKAKGKALLGEHGFRYITSLTDPEIRKTLAEGTLQLGLFEEQVTEVELPDGRRYVLRRNPAMTQRTRSRRADQLRRVEEKLAARNAEVDTIFLRKATRTRAHALVTMLALKLVRELERRVHPLGLTVQDALDRLEGVRLLTLADPALGLWRLPTRWEPEQRQVLEVLPPLPTPLLSLRSIPSVA